MERAVGVKCRRPVIPEAVLGVAGMVARITKAVTGKTGLLDEQRLGTIRERYWTADVSKLKEQLGWLPPTPLSDGVDETLTWYNAQGWL